MRKLLTLTAVAAFATALGFSGTAQADPYADEVASSNIIDSNCTGNDCFGEPSFTLGAPDALNTTDPRWATLGGGDITLNFTDNVCFVDGGNDVAVYEAGGADGYLVSVGVIGETLDGTVAGTGGGGFGPPTAENLDLSGLNASVPFWFNQIKIDDTIGGSGGEFHGVDLDAVECLSTLDQADIEKDFAVNPQDGGTFVEIDVRVKGENDPGDQQFKAFTIKITNSTGIDNAFTGLTFFDAVPAEYDLDPEGEDLADLTDDDTCADGVCNGIAEDANGKCTVTADVPQGAKAGHGGDKLRTKLEPELLSINASGLLDTEMCTTTVYVKTDKGHKKMFTPTSCPVDLNSGVKVFDVLKNLLLQDDDKLVFDAGAGTDGTCNDVENND